MTTTLKHRKVKIRKPHFCHGCLRKAPIGAEIRYYVGITEGDFNTSYWCEVCDAYVKKYSFDIEDAIGEGDLADGNNYEKFKKDFIKQKEYDNY